MKKIKLQKQHIALMTLTVLTIALFSLSAFYDLSISRELYNSSSWFGQFFYHVGELPTYLFLPFAFTVLFYNFMRKPAIYFKIIAAVHFVLALCSWFLLLERFVFSVFLPWDSYVIAFIICFILNLVTVIGFGYINIQVMNKLAKFATAFIVIALATVVLTILIKDLWGRIRFRNLLPDYSNFTPWYKINGVNGHKSFVSGHVSGASVLFSFLLLKKSFPKLVKFNVPIIIFSSVFVSLTALSRIVLGAHYLSDTLGGLLVCAGVIWLYQFVTTVIANKRTQRKKH